MRFDRKPSDNLRFINIPIKIGTKIRQVFKNIGIQINLDFMYNHIFTVIHRNQCVLRMIYFSSFRKIEGEFLEKNQLVLFKVLTRIILRFLHLNNILQNIKRYNLTF